MYEYQYGEKTKTCLMYDNYDVSKNTWSLFYKNIYNYDNNNKLAKQILLDYNNSQWISDDTITYQYYSDSNNIDTLLIGSGKDDFKYKIRYYFDDHNNCLSFIRYELKNNAWVASSKNEYFYNTNIDISDVMMPELAFAQNLITKWNTYIYQSDTWILESEVSLFYSTVTNTTTGLNENHKDRFSAFFNNDRLCVNEVVSNQIVTVYNINGQLLYKQKATTSRLYFDIPKSGIYIIDNGEQRLKVLKK